MTAEKAATSTPFEFIVVGHDISSNALGRAISLALVAQELGPTQLLAFGRGAPWKGAKQFDIPVARLSNHWKVELKTALNHRSGMQTVVWLSKGVAPLPQVARLVAKEDPSALIILDLDDDDAGLAESFARRSLLNRIRLHPLRRGNPNRIRRSQHRISKFAAAFTFSSNALASVFPSTFIPKARIPHVRRDPMLATLPSARRDAGVRFGSFGTLRPHKGSGLLLDLMRLDRSLTLVTFADCGLGAPESSDTNWIEILPDTPLSEAYTQIDVSLIPITDNSSGAQFQLPAKLIDSLQSAVPVLASPTPAINEIARNAFAELQLGASLDETIAQIKLLAEQKAGQVGRSRFLELLTPTAAAHELSTLLAPLVRTGEP